MSLMKSVHDDRRYALLLRSRQPSVSEISTNNSANRSFQKKNNSKTDDVSTDDDATCCTASTASSSLSGGDEEELRCIGFGNRTVLVVCVPGTGESPVETVERMPGGLGQPLANSQYGRCSFSTSTSSSSACVSSLRRSTDGKHKNKKTVAFAAYVDNHETIALTDMTEQEQLECWYTKEELKDIKVVMTQTVRMMVSGKLDDDTDEYCSRGLDINTTAGCAKRRQNKRMGWDAVLNEQTKQHEKAMQRKQQQQHSGDDSSCVDSRLVLDDEAIAAAYVQANLHCRKAAIMNGLRDELQSLRINNLTANTKSMMIDDDENNNSNKKDDAATSKATLGLRKRNETATKQAPSSLSFPTKTLRKYFLKRTMKKANT